MLLLQPHGARSVAKDRGGVRLAEFTNQGAFLTGSEEPITDLYKQAVAWGKEQTEKNLMTWENQEDQPAYWAAWFAGRRAAGALSSC